MRIYLIILSSIILVFGLVFLIIEWPTPPLPLLEEARTSLLNAKRAKAENFSSEQFNKAQASYDSAMHLWNIENERFLLFRKYGKLEDHLNKAVHYANLSETSAIDKDQQYWLTSQLRYEKIKDLHEYFKMTYSNFPLKENDRQKISEANLMLDEIQLALRNKSAVDLIKLTEYEIFINELISSSALKLKNYFNDFELWEALQKNALKYASDHHAYVLIIDKLSRECKIYYRTKCLATLPIELGYNWIGDKQRSGDKTTPEGMYRVIKKKANAETKFYKALLIDYPNIDDKKRHAKNIESGAIPKDSPIGGEIEIHGHGGKGTDWTDGCIALLDKDMDKLYTIIKVNTPVVIVGSTRPLVDLLEVQ